MEPGQIRHRLIAYGIWRCSNTTTSGWDTACPLPPSPSPPNVRRGAGRAQSGIMKRGEVTPGCLNAKSGMAAREYVVAATRSALAGGIVAMVTLPMNKEARRCPIRNSSGIPS